MKARMNWVNGMHFKCENSNHITDTDATIEHGGSNLAPSPKMLLLNAMMGCAAMDIIAILKKMRQEFKRFEIEIEAMKNEDYPIHFKSATLIFKIEGDIKESCLIKAVTKSLTQYCGVNYMVSKVCDISACIYLNTELIHTFKPIFRDPTH